MTNLYQSSIGNRLVTGVGTVCALFNQRLVSSTEQCHANDNNIVANLVLVNQSTYILIL